MKTNSLLRIIEGLTDGSEKTMKLAILINRAMLVEKRMQLHTSLIVKKKKLLEDTYREIAAKMSPEMDAAERDILLEQSKQAYKKISDADTLHQGRSKRYFDKVGYDVFAVIKTLEFIGRVK